MLDFFTKYGVAEIGIYCERVIAGDWQEPFNTISSLAFVVAGLLGLSLCFKISGDFLRVVMSLFVGVIGVSSFLLHKSGVPIPLAYDIIPVLLFDVCASWAIISRGYKTDPFATLLLVGFVVLTSVALSPVSRTLGFYFSGIEHLGFVLWMLLFAVVLSLRGMLNSGATLFLASAALLTALWFRSIDIEQCIDYTHGTHWLWHVANAIGIYLIIRGVPLLEGKERDFEVETQL